MHAFIKIINTCASVLLIGGMGFLLCLTEAGASFEEEIGLEWLFTLRGSLPSPSDVAIISIDQASAEILHLSEEPEKWPRAFYTSLIEKLNQQKPAIIAFNVHFGKDTEPKNDTAFAKAIAQNNNVILGDLVRRSTISANQSKQEKQDIRVIESIPILSKAAIDNAPFLLPKSSANVKKYWSFYGADNDKLTFPACVFQNFIIKEAYPEVKQLLSQIDQPAFSRLPSSYDVFVRDSRSLIPDIQTALDISVDLVEKNISDSQYTTRVKQLLQSWVVLLKNKEELYLNHYGDVGAITTIPFYQALAADNVKPSYFKDKIILIGYADNLEPEKQQGLYTVFSKVSGNAISPTEIAATAIANLLDQSWLTPMPVRDQALLILAWGILLNAIFRLFYYKTAVFLLLGLSIAYVMTGVHFLKSESIWIPLFIPMLQTLGVFGWETFDHLNKIKKVSRHYLPKDVFDKNTRNPEAMNQYGMLMQGVCMATDAGQYTTLSETINPLQLNKLMNDYYAAMFPLVKSRNGLVSDVIGDAMLAVWASEKYGIKLRRDACCAALEIKSAIDGFNDASEFQLKTRIGLHYGDMRLGNVGAMEHYEYRAVGDTVNTATRIEGLNKLLGTRILISAPVITGLSGFFTKELGTFLLKGKALPVTVFELMGFDDEIDPTQQMQASMFAKAIALYKAGQWQQALHAFRAIAKAYPDDAPTRFYITYLQQRLAKVSRKESKERATIIDVGNITTLLH